MRPRFASQPVDVGDGYSVEFTLKGDRIICEWSPRVPGKGTPEAVVDRYQEAMTIFVMARMNRSIGTFGPVTTELRG